MYITKVLYFPDVSHLKNRNKVGILVTEWPMFRPTYAIFLSLSLKQLMQLATMSESEFK